jgi:hypothetical protein
MDYTITEKTTNGHRQYNEKEHIGYSKGLELLFCEEIIENAG